MCEAETKYDDRMIPKKINELTQLHNTITGTASWQ